MPPWWAILAWYALASAVTFVAFGLDKRAARLDQRRTPERRLHILELAGGWPGAFAAMTLLRHKNRKLSYNLVTVAVALVHVGAWAWWLARA